MFLLSDAVAAKVESIVAQANPGVKGEALDYLANQVLFGSGASANSSLWGQASAEFVSSLSGNITIVSTNVNAAGVLANVEVPAILENGTITSINGVAIKSLPNTAPELIQAIETTFTAAANSGGIFYKLVDGVPQLVAVSSEVLGTLGLSTAGAESAAALAATGIIDVAVPALETTTAGAVADFLIAAGGTAIRLLGSGIGIALSIVLAPNESVESGDESVAQQQITSVDASPAFPTNIVQPLVDNGQTVALIGGASTDVVAFDSTGDPLLIINSQSFLGTISGLSSGETIDLAGVGLATSATLGTGNVLTVQGSSGGPITLNLDPSQNYAGEGFGVASDGSGGTDITVGPGEGGSQVIFPGYDKNGFTQLWAIGDTANSLVQLTDSNLGNSPADITPFEGGALYAGEATPEGEIGHDTELWITDGTASGTKPLTTGGIAPNEITAFGDKAVFESGGQLWVTDGTSDGTFQLTSILAKNNDGGLSPSDITVFGDSVLFFGNDSNGQTRLWVSDGTVSGTIQIAFSPFRPFGDGLTALGNSAVFQDTDGGIWTTDGTTKGTIQLPGGVYQALDAYPDGLPVVNGKALYAGSINDSHVELFSTDGTTAGTVEITPYKTVGVDLFPSDITPFGDTQALFSGVDSKGHRQLWITDGTAGGTHAVTSVSFSLSPTDIIPFGDKAAFLGNDSNGVEQLWITDGTSGGTQELPTLPGGYAAPTLTAFGDKLLFINVDSQNKEALWITDGTVANTTELSTLSVSGSGNTDIVVVGNKAFVSEAYGILITDGTVAGTSYISQTPDLGALVAIGGGASELACYCAGTRIKTSRGDIAVEELSVGDVMPTQLAGLKSIIWIGHRRVDCRRHPKPDSVWPVRVCAGAFGDRVPRRDLFLSPDHAVFVDDVLIPIKRLVNGTTIAQVSVDEVTYWHVELERHDVILAEGLPCESYLDNGTRNAFDNNGGSIVQMHPDFGPAERCEAIWESAGCAPLRIEGEAFERVDARLRRRAARLGYKPVRKAPRRQAKRTAPSIDLAGLLQPDWYLARNPDVAAACVDGRN